MRRFWIIILLVTGLTHVPFAVGVAHGLGRLGVAHALWIAAAATALSLALFPGRLNRARRDQPISSARRLLLEEPYFIHWCATVGALPPALLGALAVGVRALFGATSNAGAELGLVCLASYLAAFTLAFYGVVIRRRWVRVRTLDVTIPGLGEAFEGYRIAQLSDLHIGGLQPRAQGDRWAKKVAKLDVDLVALTGDYVTSGTAFHADIAAVLSSMKGRDGVVAVMGNHDYFGDGEPLVTLLRAAGVEVLRNENRQLTRGEDRMTIAGVDDTWTRRADVARTLAGRDKALPVIALAHDPQLFPALAKGGADLVLSGHTHWGQIALPFLASRYNVSQFTYRYHAGLYAEEGATLYVHPGLGTTGPPVRVGAPPEITILRLRRPKAA